MVNKKSSVILMADDDPDDRRIVEEAIKEIGQNIRISFVKNGEELLDYLHRRNGYSDSCIYPSPTIILLDLNMPCKDGREALKQIKGNAGLRRIPVVAFTTSGADEDVRMTYDTGINSFVVKPSTFNGMVSTMRMLSKYWFETVRIPNS